MRLGEYIEILEGLDPNKAVRGLGEPHSYRGDYYELAFSYVGNTTIGAMLEVANNCIGKTFEGYKGENFLMCEYSEVYLASYGCTGEALTKSMLGEMLL